MVWRSPERPFAQGEGCYCPSEYETIRPGVLQLPEILPLVDERLAWSFQDAGHQLMTAHRMHHQRAGKKALVRY